jgi:hypothetical protein
MLVVLLNSTYVVYSRDVFWALNISTDESTINYHIGKSNMEYQISRQIWLNNSRPSLNVLR